MAGTNWNDRKYECEVPERPEEVEDKDSILRFSPMVWAKLQWFLWRADGIEVSGFGITKGNDPLYVIEFVTVLQENTGASTEMDDEAVAKYIDNQVAEHNRQPKDFARIWIHTHPSFSVSPSGTDEDTMEKWFGECDNAIMVIISDTEISARLDGKILGNSITVKYDLPTKVDWKCPLETTDHEEWEMEFVANIRKKTYIVTTYNAGGNSLSQQGNMGFNPRDYSHVGILSEAEIKRQLEEDDVHMAYLEEQEEKAMIERRDNLRLLGIDVGVKDRWLIDMPGVVSMTCKQEMKARKKGWKSDAIKIYGTLLFQCKDMIEVEGRVTKWLIKKEQIEKNRKERSTV